MERDRPAFANLMKNMPQEFSKSAKGELIVKEQGSKAADKGAVVNKNNLQENVSELEAKVTALQAELLTASDELGPEMDRNVDPALRGETPRERAQRELTLHQEALTQKQGWLSECEKLGVEASK